MANGAGGEPRLSSVDAVTIALAELGVPDRLTTVETQLEERSGNWATKSYVKSWVIRLLLALLVLVPVLVRLTFHLFPP